MDIFDLFRAKPGMRFVIRRVNPHFVHKIDAYLQSVNKIQINISYDPAPKSGNSPRYIKILDNYDPVDFIRHTHDKIIDIICRIPTGAYYETSSSLVLQHRYASTQSDDTNQGYAHALEITKAENEKPAFCLHGFDTITGHEVYETSTLEQTLSLYETMLRYGFNSVKNRLEVKRQYITPPDEKPWFLQ